jgi:hypothetical protein
MREEDARKAYAKEKDSMCRGSDAIVPGIVKHLCLTAV